MHFTARAPKSLEIVFIFPFFVEDTGVVVLLFILPMLYNRFACALLLSLIAGLYSIFVYSKLAKED